MFDDAREWAETEFGGALLGDARRTARVVKMAAQVARQPGGRVSTVYETDAERQGAYDLLENPRVGCCALVESIAEATAHRAAAFSFVYVCVDGSSISIVDHTKTRNFGHLGSRNQDGRGLKVLSSIAVAPNGVPLGVCALEWWARSTTRLARSYNLPPRLRESQHWVNALTQSARRLQEYAPNTRLWFQLDREGDARVIINAASSTAHWFTIRSSVNRRLRDVGNKRRYLRSLLRRTPVIGTYRIDVPARLGRPQRTATLRVQIVRATLRMKNNWSKTVKHIDVNVVRAQEMDPPRGVEALDWTLLTNRDLDSFDDARAALLGYAQRWRIEEFHRAWKSGVCDVESMQLRATAAAAKWATILAAVAMRVERLKQLAREQPEDPATVEFSEPEIRALILLKRRRKKKTETITDDIPTIAQATTWIAELGGYTGKSSGGPPGAVTIARGLERLQPAVEMYELVSAARKH